MVLKFALVYMSNSHACIHHILWGNGSHRVVSLSLPSPAYEPAVDLWSNTDAMGIPSTYSPSLVLNLSKKNFNIKKKLS